MITKFRIGHPIETEAVVKNLPVSAEGNEAVEAALRSAIPSVKLCGEEKSLSFLMEDEDIVFGLGESVRGMNKRGWLYESNNSDESFHMEEKHALYGTHSFLLVTSRKRSFALFVDTPGHVIYDIGYTRPEELKITADDWDLDLYLIEGDSAKEIVHEFRGLIGRSYIPPKWAFGFAQSRWGYRNEADIRKVVEDYRRAGIPLDMFNMDIDYMERYKDFTVDEKAFPSFPSFV